MTERLTGAAVRHKPADPDKPLTRTLRRVLHVLAKGGTLTKVVTRDNRPGRRHLPDPSGRCYYILQPDPRHKRFKSKKTIRERTIMSATVEALIEMGYLVRFARVGRAEHLSEAAIATVKATDWNGNTRSPTTCQCCGDPVERKRRCCIRCGKLVGSCCLGINPFDYPDFSGFPEVTCRSCAEEKGHGMD